MAPQIISIAGKSDSGKTTLLEKLIAELTGRGHRIGTVKHAHDGFDLDQKGKDSWRHKKAGAAETLVITDRRVALVKDDTRHDIDKMKAYLKDTDLILAEGFKRQPLPKIEIFRKNSGHASPLCLDSQDLVAFVTDTDYRPDVPVFGPEDIKELGDFLEDRYLAPTQRTPPRTP